MSSILFSLGVHATEGLPGEIYSSIILMCILLIFCIVVKIKAHFTDPLKRPKGIVFIAETYVGYIDSLVEENMGKQFKFLSPYFGFLAAYIFDRRFWSSFSFNFLLDSIYVSISDIFND